jgi:hypothetical protein
MDTPFPAARVVERRFQRCAGGIGVKREDAIRTDADEGSEQQRGSGNQARHTHTIVERTLAADERGEPMVRAVYRLEVTGTVFAAQTACSRRRHQHGVSRGN